MSEHPTTDAPNSDRADDFFRLFAATEGRVFAYILALVPHWADAEEVFQETCVAMWRDFGAFGSDGQREPTDFFRWAAKIAIHRVYAFRKTSRRRPTSVSDEFLDCIARESQERSAELDARMRALAFCIGRLSERDRELVSHRYGAGESIKDAAAALGRPADTAYKALRRIRRKLLECVNRAVRKEDRP